MYKRLLVSRVLYKLYVFIFFQSLYSHIVFLRALKILKTSDEHFGDKPSCTRAFFRRRRDDLLLLLNSKTITPRNGPSSSSSLRTRRTRDELLRPPPPPARRPCVFFRASTSHNRPAYPPRRKTLYQARRVAGDDLRPRARTARYHDVTGPGPGSRQSRRRHVCTRVGDVENTDRFDPSVR